MLEEQGMRRNDQKDVELYWRQLEESLGERILLRYLGEYSSGFPELKGPVWGLFFLTPSALSFRTFPKDNWYESLMRSSRVPLQGQGELTIRILLTQITRVELIRSERWWERFLLAKRPVIRVGYLGAGGEVLTLRFSIEGDAVQLVEALRP